MIRKSNKLVLSAAGALSLGLIVSGCGSSSESASSTSAAPEATTAASQAAEPSAAASEMATDSGAASGVEAATALIEQYKQVPEFVAPGPAFDASSAAGKKVFYLPITSEIPYLNYVSESMQEALGLAGVEMTVNTNQGDPTQWTAAMNQAISQGVDLIVLYDVEPSLIEPQLKAAREAGIAVIQKHNADMSDPRFAAGAELVTSNLPAPYVLAGELMAAQAIKGTDGAANAIIVTSSDHMGARTVVEGMQAQFAENCPDCTTTVVDVPLMDWATKIQPELQSALAANPDANYVLPVFDGMMQWVKPAITAANATDRVGVATYNTTPFVMDMLQAGDLVDMNVGESYAWLGWGLADQALRILSGNDPVPDDMVPVRAFDSTNATEVGTPAGIETGYGDAFKDGYISLWGVE